MGFGVYSLNDISLVHYHPDLKKKQLGLTNDGDGGRITISYSGDMSSHTNTATGYVVVNRLVAKNGSCTIEVPNNSTADKHLREWIKYLRNPKTKTARFALATLTLTDPTANRTLLMTGVTPQKVPDENYDQTAGNRQYVLLYAEMTEK